MTRTPLIVGNWKMNLGPKETVEFIQNFSRLSASKLPPNVDFGIAPPFVSLPSAQQTLKSLCPELLLFSQNCAAAASGAFTGETSVAMLKECGCIGAIIGHSERRQLFGETDALIRARVTFSLRNQFRIILCIGETLEERDRGETQKIVLGQLLEAVKDLNAQEMPLLAVAYEPVWAIGTGRTATPAQAEEVHQWIRRALWDRFGRETAASLRVIYGGSVKPDVAQELMSQPNIDGFLVGGASLKPADFLSIIQASRNRGGT